ncbi:MAG: multidrug effflux MFS transporter [Nocardia sp.]|nr:multidrug effflux MFS transporter [Nocardia sp.]
MSAPEQSTDRSGGLKILAVLGALSAFGPITTDIYLPSLPHVADALHTDSAGVQTSLSTCLVGLALGQLVAGPFSDRWGRRPILLAGMATFAITSVLCAAAPNIVLLDIFRLLQGVAGAAGIAASMAVVRDLHTGAKAARAYSILMTVSSTAPMIAPVLGGQLLRVTDWRGVFGVIAGIGVVLFACTWLWIPETLAPERRHTGGLAATAAIVPTLITDRVFVGYTLAGGFSFAALFSYISSSPFVFQHGYHVSPQVFSLLFALNSLGLILASSANARLVRHLRPAQLFDAGISGALIGATLTLICVLCRVDQLWIIEIPLWVMISTIGFTQPNATALALDKHANIAGSASAVLGSVKFVLGAGAASLAGMGGPEGTAMAIVSVVAAVSAVTIRTVLVRRAPRVAAETSSV